MALEFGLVMPAGPEKGRTPDWLTSLDRAIAALPMLRGLWMTDHFFWDDAPTYEAWTALAFAAARWPALTIGPIVLGQGYRNPALTAKMAATLHALTGGRLIMALGAGWKEDEFHAYGYPFPTPGARVTQLGETLEIVTRLWREPGRVTFVGEHYRVRDAYCEPKPEPPPLLIVGGAGDKTLRLAARYADWWNMPDAGLDSYRARSAALDLACRDCGRDPASLRRTWFGRLALAHTREAAEALSNGRWTRENAIVGTADEVRAQLRALADAGVSYVMAEFLGADDAGRLREIAGMMWTI